MDDRAAVIAAVKTGEVRNYPPCSHRIPLSASAQDDRVSPRSCSPSITAGPRH